jgi:hypothetical protein
MIDLLGNEIHIGDKVIYAKKYQQSRDLDYGIVDRFTETGDKCYCNSLILPKNYRGSNSILRTEKQIVKIG